MNSPKNKSISASIATWFTYHPASPAQAEAYEQLRAGGRTLAELIAQLTPPSADQTLAIRRVREAIMCAHAAIACGGV